MSRLRAIIHREWTENVRQRALVGTLAALLATIAVFAIFLLFMLDGFASDPGVDKRLGYWMDVMGMPMEDPLHQLTSLVVQALDYLLVTQLLSMTAVLAGHAALHDRQSGTLPFLLLAPITRLELLVGKVLGAMALPLLLYCVIGGSAALYASTLSVADAVPGFLPPSAGWTIAFFVGAPAWATFIGALCVAISSLSRDVRTAQQAAWFLVFFATFVVCPLLVNLMPAGAVTQLIVAGVGLLLAGAALVLGTVLLSRDLGR